MLGMVRRGLIRVSSTSPQAVGCRYREAKGGASSISKTG